ncbi:unnamed protein product, partial [Prorocentrum cordatum]
MPMMRMANGEMMRAQVVMDPSTIAKRSLIGIPVDAAICAGASADDVSGSTITALAASFCDGEIRWRGYSDDWTPAMACRLRWSCQPHQPSDKLRYFDGEQTSLSAAGNLQSRDGSVFRLDELMLVCLELQGARAHIRELDYHAAETVHICTGCSRLHFDCQCEVPAASRTAILPAATVRLLEVGSAEFGTAAACVTDDGSVTITTTLELAARNVTGSLRMVVVLEVDHQPQRHAEFCAAGVAEQLWRMAVQRDSGGFEMEWSADPSASELTSIRICRRLSTMPCQSIELAIEAAKDLVADERLNVRARECAALLCNLFCDPFDRLTAVLSDWPTLPCSLAELATQPPRSIFLTDLRQGRSLCWLVSVVDDRWFEGRLLRHTNQSRISFKACRRIGRSMRGLNIIAAIACFDVMIDKPRLVGILHHEPTNVPLQQVERIFCECTGVHASGADIVDLDTVAATFDRCRGRGLSLCSSHDGFHFLAATSIRVAVGDDGIARIANGIVAPPSAQAAVTVAEIDAGVARVSMECLLNNHQLAATAVHEDDVDCELSTNAEVFQFIACHDGSGHQPGNAAAVVGEGNVTSHWNATTWRKTLLEAHTLTLKALAQNESGKVVVLGENLTRAFTSSTPAMPRSLLLACEDVRTLDFAWRRLLVRGEDLLHGSCGQLGWCFRSSLIDHLPAGSITIAVAMPSVDDLDVIERAVDRAASRLKVIAMTYGGNLLSNCSFGESGVRLDYCADGTVLEHSRSGATVSATLRLLVERLRALKPTPTSLAKWTSDSAPGTFAEELA